MTRRCWQMSWSAAVLVIATVGATPAAAQSHSQARFEIAANVGAQTGAGKFTESTAFPSNGGETATVTVDHGVQTALGFNLGAAVKVVSQFWLGVQYAIAETKPSASVTAVIPHPILFGAPRTVEGPIDNVAHNERNVHVELMYALRVGGVDAKVMAGPTFFSLKQDFVSDVAVNETFPFDTATFASATTKRLSKTAVGFNAGVDISHALASSVAVGALIRYSRSNMKFDDPDIGPQTVKVGGVEAGVGVRFRF
jgi:opacity protein-like surface antigen